VGQIKNNSSNKNPGYEWEETLVDTGPFRPRTVKPLFNYEKFRWVYFIIFLIFLVILGRVFYLQILMGENLRSAAEENRYRIYTLSAPRGVIYDRNNNLLVRNVPAFDLVIIPADLPKGNDEREKIWENINSLIVLEEGEREIFHNDVNLDSYQPILVKKNISREDALMLETKIKDFPGIKIEKVPIREYVLADDFSHILGYIGKINSDELEEVKKTDDTYQPIDYIGKDGIEKRYEKNLKGKVGREQVEVDSLGNVKKTVAKEEPIVGQNLVLTIDKDLQAKVTEFLGEGIRDANTKKGVCIVMDVKSGEILSLVSLPSFDNNLFSEGISEEDYNALISNPEKPLYNRAVSGLYPPGSTIKPVIAAGGLQEGTISANTTINDAGVIDVPNKYNPDIVYHFVGWERSGLGLMNLYSAIAKSSDIYFYYLGGGYEDFKGLGAEKIIQYYRKFGLGKKTGIDLPDEADGLIPTFSWKEEVKGEEWYLGDTYHISIGQGDLLTTPLQVLSWTATIANGGEFLQPHILKEFMSNEDVIYKNEKKVNREKFINDEYINLIQRAMRETVLDGSGRSLSGLPISVAGKTGTAQHKEDKENHAWFTAFAPYEDPEIAVVVLAEEGGDGDKAAVPIAGKVLEWYFSEKEQKTEE
jgi:penicillin-binding protein 2